MDGSGGGGAALGALGLLFLLVGGAVAVGMIRRAVIRRRLLATGVTVQARCLDTFTRGNGRVGATRHAILAFTTLDGREIRAQLVVDFVVTPGAVAAIRYDPARPDRAALVRTRAGTVVSGCGAAVVLVVCAVFVLMGLGAVVTGFGL